MITTLVLPSQRRPQWTGERAVRVEPVDVVELVDRQPADPVVLAGTRRGLAVDEVCDRNPQEQSGPDRHLRVEPAAHPDAAAELLSDLADKRRLRRLPRLDLPAGELPAAGRLGWIGATCGQHPSAAGQPLDGQPLDDRGADDQLHDAEGTATYVGPMVEHDVHLRRTAENTHEIDRLVEQHGGRAALAGVSRVAATLDRTATRAAVPGLCVDWGLRWDEEDTASTSWWPQGITNSAHVPGVDRRLLVASWYAKDGRGSRITVLDLDTLRYRHVLLVVPELDGDRIRLRPLTVHAGGIVWAGPYLYVAGTRRGLFTCRMDEIVELEPTEETFGHRFVLPVRFAYDAAGDTDQMRYSFLSLDRSPPVPHLVAGEYGRGEMTRRLVRYPLDPQTHRLAAEPDGVSRPATFDERGLGHMQGAAVVAGRYHVTVSRGRWRLGALHVGRPGDFRTLPHALPVGPEDICYWEADGDRLWSLSEYPTRRFAFCISRSTLPGG